MTDKRLVIVTCAGQEEAERLARTVVGQGLAACASVLPQIRSCYMWEGNQTWSDEVMILIKTTSFRFPALEQRIRELHSYEVPEIISVAIDAGSEKYLQWVGTSVGL